MERNPHLLFEGCLIGCYAIGAKVAYIYIRGEFRHVQRVLEAEIEAARAAGYIGKNILGSGFDCEIYVHPGAGASRQARRAPCSNRSRGSGRSRDSGRRSPPSSASTGARRSSTTSRRSATSRSS